MKDLVKKNKLIFNIARKAYVNFSYFKNKSILAKNKELAGAYQGQRCFVIGNGPSLNQLDLAKLKDEQVFACNLFYRHDLIETIRPDFYSMIEPILLDESFRRNLFPDIINGINTYAATNSQAKFFLNIQNKE